MSVFELDLNPYYILSRIKDYAREKNIYTFELKHAL